MSVFIVGAKRTPFGAFGGALTKLTGTDLATVASKAALAAGNVDPSLVDATYVGSIIPGAADAAYVSRHTALRCGVPQESPALTINRLCGSGFQSVICGAEQILLNESQVTLCAGTENMSQAPLAVYGHKARWGTALGAGLQLEDTLWSALTDSHTGLPMGITAENLAEKYNISREECDAYALQSQQRWGAANEGGHFTAELAPVEYKGKRGMETLEVDEHPRPSATLESMAKLPSVFKKDGTVTAANASGICDGAGALVLASEQAATQNNLTPLARIVSWQVTGCDPTIMGIGPVSAIRGALTRADLTMGDMDLVEINEAFAAQYLACAKELELDNDKSNTNGGAIALGHPLAASGSRITAHLVHELHRTGGRYAVGAACIGGGQGIAIVLEKQ